MLISRIPQIYKNFTSKSTGTLSFINYFLNFVGCTARIFTVMKETNDIKMLIVHANGLFTNLLIVIQIAIYWANTNKILSGLKKGKKTEKPESKGKSTKKKIE